MRPICSVQAVRRAEAGAGVAEPVLMQRASSALAGICLDLLRGGRGGVRGAHVVALAGSGNNGGDALWALAHLARRGVATSAVGDPERMHAAGAAAATSAGASLFAWDDPEVGALISSADLVLDGILGIGGVGAVREPAAGAVRTLLASDVPVVAVDVPSGVDSDSGQVAGLAVRADVTVCFGVLKPALVVPPARHLAGSVTVVDIGLRAGDLEPVAWALSLADLPIASPAPGAHKYSRGVVGVTAGSTSYPGAALLAVGGARMSGAGMVAFGPASRGSQPAAEPAAGAGARQAPAGGIDPVAAMVVAQYPDVVLAAGRAVDARCIGPGLGMGPDAVESVLRAMAEPAPLVIDASALAVLARQDGRRALAERAGAGWVTVLTPHSGEFPRAGFDPSGGPLVAAQRAAQESGAVIVLKGPGTLVAAPGVTYVDTFGDATLATAGSGDVLAGLIAGMLAAAGVAGVEPAGAALVAARAVGLHGLAGRLAAARGGPVTAVEVLGHLGTAHAAAASALT